MAVRRYLPLVLPCALVAVLLGSCDGGGEQPDRVRVGTVARGDVAEVVEAPGTVTPRAAATLRAPAAGTIERLHVTDGDRVREGQVLAVIDSPAARERLRQAREADADVTAGAPPAGVDLAGFQRDAEEIARRGFGTARRAARQIPDPEVRARVLADIAEAEARYATAAAAARAAVARLNAGLGSVSSAMTSITAAQRVQTGAAVRAAERTVRGLTLRAPFDGVAGLGGPAAGAGDLADRLPQQLQGQAGLGGFGGGGPTDAASVAVGAPIGADAAVVTVTDVSRLTLTAEVDETDILQIRPGVTAEAELDALPGATYPAEVTGVGVTPRESASGGVTYKVTLRLDRGADTAGRPAPWPKPGMSAVIDLRIREVADAVAVPSSAVLTSGRDSTVWVVTGGRAQRRVVRLGAQGDAVVEVTSGLRVGERIVVRGAGSVRQGQEIPDP
ncbi:efflux RND transporter periplasmic adaptor subunit [Thermomonospora cellulosilytica]|uniref:Multidrug efflux pump subunit AcrA (Membrane-fusion protein) n=1 Tax=Thermomonospora cellulosilytica TaxID=1411118 RepID=A0A7W3R6K9_9ACTN|nr:HlyD family efflux transporter periplasmic adaptor subunit [Thermomonospora cellulosilytica]MBA9001455.1 multidrug efflux pump subunit AcrA (membrane-fusion protein) [Thermomonospora cellulosilytica]